MTSKTGIANLASIKLGESRVTDVDNDNNKIANTYRAIWDAVRDSELRANRWSFSIARVALSANPTPPLFGFSTSFALPVDCVRILTIGTNSPSVNLSSFRNGDDSDYAVEGRAILTNDAGPLYLRYCASIVDTTVYDSAFVEAFACRLAAEACESLTQSSEKRTQAWGEYDRAMRAARRANAIEKPPQGIPDDSWVLVRTRG